VIIAVEISGDRRAGLRFDEFPRRAHDAILARITGLTAQLEARVLGRVPVATGDLRRMVQSFVDDHGTRIAGKVKVIAGAKSDHGKAAALEYGAHGSFEVKAHTRTVTSIFGRVVAPTEIFIAAYGRAANIEEQRFLRGPLAEMRGEIIRQLTRALAETGKGA
jgi:hypothetical protein